jgi:predicted lipoprotein with Yx(FWY)xxD motif
MMEGFMKFYSAAACALLVLTASAAALAGPMTKDGVLTAEDGMTLYVFDKDEAGKSNCNDACAANWPPFAAMAGDKAMGDFSLIQRADGMMQWAHKGRPLYRWIKDVKAGDMTGDGFKGVWHVVGKPADKSAPGRGAY